MGVNVVLARRGRESASLRIEGPLRPGWCGSLATSLAARGIGIESGHAVTPAPGSWRAELELRCPPSWTAGSDEVTAMLGAETGAGFTTPIVLLAYRLEASIARGGCLVLDVEGEDRVGFLAALLRRLAYYSLFPVELRLRTSGGRVCDRLWLRGGGSCAPLPRTEKALAASLDALVRRPEPTTPLREGSGL